MIFLINIVFEKVFERENLNFGDFVEKINFLGHLMAKISFGGFDGPLAQILMTRLAIQVH